MLQKLKTIVNNKDNKTIFRIWVSFLLVEVFAYCFLAPDGVEFTIFQLSPLAFAVIWASLLTSILYVFHAKVARVLYACIYFFITVYAGFQTGYHIMFSEMMWLSEFRYASEGADYASVLLSYPIGWWLGIACMIVFGIYSLLKFTKWETLWKERRFAGLAAMFWIVAALLLPKVLYVQDQDYEKRSDYKRMESVEAAYENMFNVLRLYQVCGLYQTAAKDIYFNEIYPLTPGYVQAQEEGHAEIDAYFSEQGRAEKNNMTGLLAGKNVVLVLMESVDDWMIGEHTPTIEKLMSEGINFTKFYTPVYGGIRTFNSEFCMNTGSFLSSQGGYAFDYVTNTFHQSLANLLGNMGYSSITFHFNSPDFYSRGEFSPAMGYEQYIYYVNYLDWGTEESRQMSTKALDNDQVLFDNGALNSLFFREGGPRLNFIISNAAHLPYDYSNSASKLGFELYPEYYGLTGHEETDCALVKVKMFDDFFNRLLLELESKNELDNTVIIAVSDHYTYGFEDTDTLMKLSGVDSQLLLERTPCFIWSADMEAMEVDKVLNTSDLLPTVLNMLGVESEYDYIGKDAFDESYEGFVPFSNGSWISGDVAYDASTKEYISISGQQVNVSAEFQKEMAEKVQEFVRINNLILDTDYYK